MLGIDFFIANTIKETAYLNESVKFNEESQGYLQIKEDYGKGCTEKGSFDLLIGLDQYGATIF
ncbi:hypothetical protein [Peribacillus sp. NPDC060253]|uniref:hypothetical protein n=1 Tax=Peribacillus sp. NPDC060253 TaxID=3347084 RepID=UPI00365A1BAE